MKAQSTEPPRIPALDGIRGLAIALVIPFHFVGQYAPTHALSAFGKVARAGWVGVDLFFVLSGFLITGILIEQRGARCYYAAFYWRRALRILPAFVALMVVLWLIAVLLTSIDPLAAERFRQWQPWYWTFTMNWLALGVGGAGVFPYGTGYLWSLSVEENFYFIWPALVAFLPREALSRALWTFIALAFVTRATFLLTGDPTNAAHTFTLSRLDSLSAGGLVAIGWRNPAMRQRLARWTSPLANAPGIVWLAVAGMVYGALRALDPDTFPRSVPMRAVGFTLTAAIGSLLIVCALTVRSSSALGRFCLNPVMRGLGRYAYALYLFHVLVALAIKMLGVTVDRLAVWTGSLLVGELAFTAVAGSACYAVAAASWKLIERPALAWKDLVPYAGLASRREVRARAEATRP